MPRISLRTYEKEIEELIEQNKLSEAIAHCKQILQSFPKNISTYRILGKAFLEGKQYKETADIFTRVLTVFPDDFIAHVGMSIVRESEKNLDAAIWHMQLAFDNQPSNIAIQEELKRLFDLRDGTHPDKIRLTRGALVRMYARGELYQQAIDEIKSALLEEPKRIDLQVFLAKMYQLSGDQDEAFALSEKLITDLPYCFEINRILVELLSSSGNASKTAIFANRLIELNPYQAFVNEIYPSADQIPDERVVIEKLVDTSMIVASNESKWIESIQSDWKEQSHDTQEVSTAPAFSSESVENNEKPTFLNELSQTPEEETIQQEVSEMSTPSDPVNEDTSAQNPSEDKIPEWMRESGWVPASAESKPETNETPVETHSDEEGDALSAEIPDWLKSLSQEQTPSTPTAEEETPVEPEPAVNPPAFSDAAVWMNDIAVENTPVRSENDTDLPDWLKNFETEDKNEPISKDDLPDWLNSLKGDSTSAPTANPFVGVSNPDESISEPTIVNPLDEPVTPPSVENEEKTISEEESKWQPADTIETASANASITPNVETEAEAEAEASLDPNSTITKETEDDLLNWLRDLKPLDTSVETTTEPASGVPEESLDNEEQRYDFAVQLERLQQLSDNPSTPSDAENEPAAESQSAEIPATEEDSLAEKSSEQPDEIPVSTEFSSFESENQKEEETAPLSVDGEEAPTSVNTETIDETSPETPVSEETYPVIEEPKTTDSLPEPVSEETGPTSQPESEAQPVSEPTLEELKEQAESHSEDYLTWQKLGDAYASAGDLLNALSAYNQAESILTNSK